MFAFLFSLYMGEAQRFYFFCINIGENSDGNYIAEQIDAVLQHSNLSKDDAFIVYIRGGANQSGKMYDSYLIEDMNVWKEKKSKISGLKQYSVLPKPEVDNLLRLFQDKYEVKGNSLTPKCDIYVYWFADKNYYENYGSDILLKLYVSCMDKNMNVGNKGNTWRQCNVYADRPGGFPNMSFGELLKSPVVQYGNIKMIK